jgi:hypothetical protein
MKFLADENMDVAIVERLRQEGHLSIHNNWTSWLNIQCQQAKSL